MIRNTLKPRLLALVCAGCLLTAGAAGQTFTIDWYTIDAGGATFTTGGDFELSGTIGQHDAMPTTMTGGGFTLVGGFWAGVTVGEFCFGDLDGDGQIGLGDLAILLANYEQPSGMQYEDGDLDGDGDVDLADLAQLLSVYGTNC